MVHRILLTSATCIAALNRTRLNADERRRMRPKMRPPGSVERSVDASLLLSVPSF